MYGALGESNNTVGGGGTLNTCTQEYSDSRSEVTREIVSKMVLCNEKQSRKADALSHEK